MSETRFVQSNDIVLHYQQIGVQVGPPLVFINSLGSDLRIWDSVVPHFASHFPVIRYDKRGHGLSDCPAAPYTLRDHSHDLLGLLDALHVQATIVIGISVGGQIAMDFADRYPTRVKALILADTAPKIGTPAMWDERINTLRQGGMAVLGDAILARWFAPQFADQAPAAYAGYYNMLTRTPVEGYTGTCEAIRDADLREVVNTIRVKTLVMCGAEDMATPPDAGRDLAAALPNARFTAIEGAAHLPCIEQPDAMVTVMKQFLEEAGYGG